MARTPNPVSAAGEVESAPESTPDPGKPTQSHLLLLPAELRAMTYPMLFSNVTISLLRRDQFPGRGPLWLLYPGAESATTNISQFCTNRAPSA
jgi:hypothetical protein